MLQLRMKLVEKPQVTVYSINVMVKRKGLAVTEIPFQILAPTLTM